MKSDGRVRDNVAKGAEVLITLKRDQRTGKLTRGIVKDILTNSKNHPHGIKVRLTDGRVGRVQQIVSLPLAKDEIKKAEKKSLT